MLTFPVALSAALFQYPTSRQVRYTTQVLRFVGGQEQRYELADAPVHRWDLKPGVLCDATMAELADFFELVGRSGISFGFTDPWDKTTYPACYFESDSLEHRLMGQGRHTVSFTILEGRDQT